MAKKKGIVGDIERAGLMVQEIVRMGLKRYHHPDRVSQGSAIGIVLASYLWRRDILALAAEALQENNDYATSEKILQLIGPR